MGFFVCGILVSIVGWLMLIGGVGRGVGGFGEVANLHAMIIATNVILAGYALVVAGLIRDALDRRNSFHIPAQDVVKPTPVASGAPDFTPSPERRFLKAVSVSGIPGKLYSDGSIDVTTASGTMSFPSGEDVKAAFGKK